MTIRNAGCLAEFSLSPLFRRKWLSIYEALQDSRPQKNLTPGRVAQSLFSLLVEIGTPASSLKTRGK
nr:hypothetical protein [Hyella patelloides]